MAKYRFDKPAWVQGRYINADVRNPAYVEFPDDFVPSRTWDPVDKAAQEALFKLAAADVQRAKDVAAAKKAAAEGTVVIPPVPSKKPLVEVEAPEAPKKDDGLTMSDLAKMRVGQIVGAE